MCDPMTALAVASVGASIGGNILQSNEAAANQANAINAKNKSVADQFAQQAALQKKATDVFDSTLTNFQGDKPAENLASNQAANTAAIANNAPTAASLAPITTGAAPKVVQDSEKQSVADRIRKIGQFGANLGNLTGYDTANAAAARGLKDAGLNIGTIGNFAQEDANVGNAQMNANIANSQKAPSPWGDLLSGAGQLGSVYAGQNGAFGNLFGKSLPKNAVLSSVSGIYS